MINIHDGQITDLLSNTLRYNPETISIGYAVLQEKRRILALAERTRLMAAVEVLDEKTLDYLAVELRTPAYEDDLPLETKRTLIKGTLPFYARLGTPSSVDWVINAVFGNGGIEEWFEYGGEPHHFRIRITMHNTVMPTDRFEQLVRSVYHVKRLSSWLDEIIFTVIFPPATLRAGGGVGVGTTLGLREKPDVFDRARDTVQAGGGVGVTGALGVREQRDTFHFQDTVHAGGKYGSLAALPQPESLKPPSSPTILRVGGVCTILSNP